MTLSFFRHHLPSQYVSSASPSPLQACFQYHSPPQPGLPVSLPPHTALISTAHLAVCPPKMVLTRPISFNFQELKEIFPTFLDSIQCPWCFWEGDDVNMLVFHINSCHDRFFCSVEVRERAGLRLIDILCLNGGGESEFSEQ